MPSSSIIIPFRNLLSVLLFLPLVLSCRQDEPFSPAPPTPGKGETTEVTLTLHIPDFRAANTRAGVDEEKIDEITVLMFAEEGGTEKVKVKKNISNFSLYDGDAPDMKFFSIPVTAGTYKRISLVANAGTELSGINVGSTYDALKQVEVTGKFGQKGGTEPDSYIPMYGEYAPTEGIKLEAGVSQTIAQAIPLIRMLARVDIINPATSGATTVGEVYFVNPAGNGRVWVDPATYNTSNPQSGYMVPTLPGTLQKANGSDPLLGAGASGAQVITYYLNEQPATSTTLTTSGNNRPCIVMILAYQGRQYYYRMDYTWDGIKGGNVAPYEKGKPMPILRNHRYIFTIKEVKGPGFLTLSEAIQSPENHTNQNIVVTPVVIDEAFTDVTFNNMGQYIAVTRTAMTLKGKKTTASTDNKVEVLTNVAGGFSVRAFNENGMAVPVGGWLKPNVNTGAANSKQTVQAITNGLGKLKGYLEICAGRLYTKVNVEQLWKLPLEYVAEYNLAGGFQYGSSFSSSIPAGASPTGAQTESALRWASNHNNNQSGYYNWYVCKGIYDATYNPNTKNLFNDSFFSAGNLGHGYHLPSYWELTGVFSYDKNAIKYGGNTNKPVNEACEFGGIKKTYLSTYYSSGNGVCYAIRFKQATGNPIDGSPLSEFPKATDNSMCCAYRYTRIGSFANDNNLNSQLKVDCVYLGEAGASTNIYNDDWWNTHSVEIVTRIFPAAGSVSPAAVSSSGVLSNQGYFGYYWSGTENKDNNSNAMVASCGPSNASTYYSGRKHDGVAVRLFASE
ncbi:fimbrial protein [Bacteroides pyogenes]|uniref:fimbrial protein n=1 Tax=Bacteroides pyogenes TaxID=310300 RepID=UPI001F3405D7|nr:fimbrial protein [Bacteroides pyogenes]